MAAMVLLFILAACSKDSPQNYLHPVGPIAKTADGLWKLTFGIAAVVFVIVEGLIVVAIIRFKEKSPKDPLPKQTHGNTKAEIAWTVAPALVLALIAVPTVSTIFKLAKEQPNSLQVKVIAHQWWWEYRYKESGVVTANELHIPTDRNVYLTLESDDVIHSYWVPKLAGKQDVVPGRVNHMTLNSPKVGTFEGQCTEYCGFSHANMRLKVMAQSPADFDQWLADQKRDASHPSGTLAAEGERLFTEGKFAGGQSCANCHTVKGTDAQGTFAPNLTHVASRTSFAGSMFEFNDANLRAWLTDPPGRKPGSKMPNLHLSDSQLEALVSYLDSLK